MKGVIRTLAIFAISVPTLLLFGCGKDWEIVRTKGMSQYVNMPTKHEADVTYYQSIIDDACTPGKSCMIAFYSDEVDIPKTGDIPDSIEKFALANYIRNVNTGHDKLLLNCRIKNDPDNCFR